MNKNQKGFGLFGIAIILVALFILGLITYLFFSNPSKTYNTISKLNNSKENNLSKIAAQKGTDFSGIKILDEQATQAKGIVDGDALTANPNPDISTYAQAKFTTSSPLNVIESQVSINLSKSGFTREGPSDAPYYKTYTVYGNSPFDVIGSAIEFRYIKGSNAIKLAYIFDKAYSCPSGKICERTAKSMSTDDIYDVRAYATLNVIRVNAKYAQKDNYLVQL